MDFKIPNAPNRTSYIEEIADFWELQAAIESNRSVSKVDIIKLLSIESDELKHDGIISEEDKIDIKLDTVIPEFSKRSTSCSSQNYPFEINRASIKIRSIDDIYKYAYLFLLLCTRLNMSDNRTHAGINGAYLFEKICRIVGENYFGNLAESFHFGTGNQGDFPDKVGQLINQLKEGKGYKNINDHRNLKNDDGLDVVFWKNFSDKDEGKLIGFGQCKTGTSWEDSIHDLRPRTFCKKWFMEQPFLDPIPIAFISDTLKSEKNLKGIKVDCLFFNRFRIMEYIPDEIDQDLEKDLRTWVDEALNQTIASYA